MEVQPPGEHNGKSSETVEKLSNILGKNLIICIKYQKFSFFFSFAKRILDELLVFKQILLRKNYSCE